MKKVLKFAGFKTKTIHDSDSLRKKEKKLSTFSGADRVGNWIWNWLRPSKPANTGRWNILGKVHARARPESILQFKKHWKSVLDLGIEPTHTQIIFNCSSDLNQSHAHLSLSLSFSFYLSLPLFRFLFANRSFELSSPTDHFFHQSDHFSFFLSLLLSCYNFCLVRTFALFRTTSNRMIANDCHLKCSTCRCNCNRLSTSNRSKTQSDRQFQHVSRSVLFVCGGCTARFGCHHLFVADSSKDGDSPATFHPSGQRLLLTLGNISGPVGFSHLHFWNH